MFGLLVPINKGSVHIMSGLMFSLSGFIISGFLTYAINIVTNFGLIRVDEFVTYLDEGLKINIKSVENFLNKIMKFESVSYDKKASGKKEVGFIV